VTPPRPSAERVEAALARLKRLHPSVIDLTLERVHRLLARLGHPERALAPVAHVAGTNGKGSTVAFLRAFLEAAGLRVHVYTSPHLVRFNERIRIAGRIVGDDALASLLEECETVNAGEPITFFEITTCAAFLAFAREPADIVLLETGLGGRLDATNVVARPAVTAITPVSMDHMDYLGSTLDEIAAEKAGILKPGVPCVLAPQAAAAEAVVMARAAALGTPLDRCGADWRVELRRNGFALGDGEGTRAFPMPALAGPHQPVNAAVAIRCLAHLPVAVDEAAVVRGLAAVDWPGRLQHLASGPLAALLPEGWQLWADAGHNPDAAGLLARTLGQWRDGPPWRLVVGMLADREPRDFLAPLAAHVSDVAAVPVPGEPRSRPPAGCAAAARDLGLPAVEAPGVAEALRSLVLSSPAPARILVTGSLALVGTVLRDSGAVIS
jgi:dihydrofolate synthase/folylpolyglutamate synthase